MRLAAGASREAQERRAQYSTARVTMRCQLEHRLPRLEPNRARQSRFSFRRDRVATSRITDPNGSLSTLTAHPRAGAREHKVIDVSPTANRSKRRRKSRCRALTVSCVPFPAGADLGQVDRRELLAVHGMWRNVERREARGHPGTFPAVRPVATDQAIRPGARAARRHRRSRRPAFAARSLTFATRTSCAAGAKKPGPPWITPRVSYPPSASTRALGKYPNTSLL